jgi:ribosomal protein S21
MGVRIVLAEKEPIGLALRRLKKRMEREGGILSKVRRRGSFIKATDTRRAKKFKKRFKAREATLLAKMAGEQPTELSKSELLTEFWKRTGKP